MWEENGIGSSRRENCKISVKKEAHLYIFLMGDGGHHIFRVFGVQWIHLKMM